MVIELAAVFMVLILPPLLTTKGNGISKAAEFSPYVVIQFFTAAVLFYQNSRLSIKSNAGENKGKIPAVIRNLFWFSMGLGSLMLVFACTQTLSLIFHLGITADPVPPGLEVKHFYNWIFLFLAISTGAFYEEVLYRLFFPSFMHGIFDKKNKILFYFVELISVLIFAFSHRYLGMISVLNAFFCGIILRLCLSRSKSLFPGFLAHFTYNISLIVFSLLMP